MYPPPPPPPLRNQEVDISREDPRRVSPASPQPSATTTTGHEHHHKDHYRYHSRDGGDKTQHPRDGGGGADGRTHNPPTPLQGNVDDNPAISAHRDGCQCAAPPPPPPPVACTLVAFEPGSLGLELEAVVVESTGVGGSDGRRRGEEGQAVGRGKEGRRLGCRVFRVTPDGQAARHGSVHPGDALVVLDG